MKRLFFVVCSIILTIYGSFAINYNEEWKRVDSLMDQVALRDAAGLVKDLYEVANKDNNHRQMLRAEIYSFAIDMGCEASLYDLNHVEVPHNTNIEEGNEILDNHYLKALSLLNKFDDKIERAFVQYYILTLFSEYHLLNNEYHLLNQRDKYTLRHDSLRSDAKLSQLTYLEFVEKYLSYQDSLLNFIGSLGSVPTSDYDDFLIIKENNKQVKLLDVFVDALLQSAKNTVDKSFNFQSYNLPTLDRCTSFAKDTFFSAKNQYFEHRVYVAAMNACHKNNDVDMLVKYDVDRINNYLEFCRFPFSSEHADSVALAAIDNLVDRYPDNPNIIGAEVLRSTILTKDVLLDRTHYKADTVKIKMAVDILDKLIEKFNGNEQLELAYAHKQLINRHSLKVKCKDMYHSGTPIIMSVCHANVKKLNLKLKRTSLKCEQFYDSEDGIYDINLSDREKELNPSNYYYTQTDTIDLGCLDYGAYKLEVCDVDDSTSTKNISFVVSDLMIVPYASEYMGNDDDDDYEIRDIYVVDNKSGKPVSGVKLTGDIKRGGNTDRKGKRTIKIDPLFSDHVCAVKGKDQYTVPAYLDETRFDDNGETERYYVRTFTDRNTYRPGQVVKFCCVCYLSTEINSKVAANVDFEAVLSFGWGNDIDTVHLVTNDFGKCYGEFHIPDGDDAVGDYNITIVNKKLNIRYRDASFEVVAYKLKQFEIVFDMRDFDYKIKKDVPVTGVVKNYSGETLPDVNVDLIVNGNLYKLITDAKGRFSAVFHPTQEDLDRTQMNLSIEATAISPSGEKATANKNLTLYKYNVYITICQGKETDLSSSKSFFINCRTESNYFDNNQSVPIEKNVKIFFKSHKDSTKIFSCEKQLYGITEIQIPKELFDTANFGKYYLQITDIENGDTLLGYKREENILVFDSRTNVVASDATLWLSVSENGRGYMLQNDTVRVSISTVEDSLYVLYRLTDTYHRIISEKWILLNKEMKTLSLTYKDVFGHGDHRYALISLFAFKNGRPYSDSFWLKKAYFTKRINPKISIHRNKVQENKLQDEDRILAGTHQKWSIEVPDIKDPLSISAIMTDLALDEIKKQNWNIYFDRLRQVSLSQYDVECKGIDSTSVEYVQKMQAIKPDSKNVYPLWSVGTNGYVNSKKGINKSPLFSGVRFSSKDFNGECIVRGYVTDDEEPLPFANVMVDGTSIGTNTDMDGYFELVIPNPGCMLEISYSGYETKLIKVNGSMFVSVKLNVDLYNELVVTGYGVVKTSDYRTEIKETPRPTEDEERITKIRSNFSECAFFYPDLRPKNGKVDIEFDAPESLTRWKIRLLAISKDLQYGFGLDTIVTYVPFSVRPLVPRVFRTGDNVEIAATVTHHEGDPVSGVVKFTFEDEKTDSVLFTKDIDFKIAANHNHTVRCMFSVPDGVESIKMTVRAITPDFSDGETHSVFVVPNRSHVIKAQSSLVRKDEKKRLTVVADTSDNVQVVVDYATNGLWKAIMTMPSVTTSKHSNAIDYAVALYVNAIANNMKEDYPQTYDFISQWSVESPLSQNEELKDATLEFSPWRLDAVDDNQQRSDVKKMLKMADSKVLYNINKLEKLQNRTGSFSWYEGGNPSLWTTVYVAQLLSDMKRNKLKGFDYWSVEKCRDNVLRYLDVTLVGDYQEYKKSVNEELSTFSGFNSCPSELVVRKVCLRLETEDYYPLVDEAKIAVDSFYAEIKKNWKHLTLYGKARLSQILIDKHDPLAKTILRSMLQTYTQSEHGIYWKENQNYCSWSNSAISVHAEVMRALIKSGLATKEELDEMTAWLITRCEATKWQSSVSTVNAIDILCRVSSTDFGEGSVTLPNGDTVSTKNGYVKRTIHGVPGTNSIDIAGTENGIGFASLYVSYDAVNADVNAASNHIKIMKKAYRVDYMTVKGTPSHELLTEIKEGDVLRLGDKVRIEITVENDQDLDYVHVKDVRASCFEPEDVLSGYRWYKNCSYYKKVTDVGYSMFFDKLKKGFHTFSYTVNVSAKGSYSSGLATAECMYSPSFRGNSDSGVKFLIEGQ